MRKKMITTHELLHTVTTHELLYTNFFEVGVEKNLLSTVVLVEKSILLTIIFLNYIFTYCIRV